MDETRRHAVITGGSRGIGMAIVGQLLRDGFDIWYLSRTEGKAKQAFRQFAVEHGRTLTWIPCDMADGTSVETALERLQDEAKTIDVLVNNAGITCDGLLMRMSDEAWERVLATNLTGTFRMCRKIGRTMATQRSGAVVNIASVVGLSGNAGQTNYAASKAGIVGFSKSMAKELAGRKVRVNVVAPGFIDTAMTSVLGDQAKENLVTQIPLKRIGRSEEVAQVVSFLASDAASYITGQVLAVDGGMTM